MISVLFFLRFAFFVIFSFFFGRRARVSSSPSSSSEGAFAFLPGSVRPPQRVST